MQKTFVDFLNQAADLESLPRIPKPGGEIFRFDSTWDRTGGNFDGGDWTDMPHDERSVTLVDLQGPGCVHRIYSAFPSGQLQFYFDGESKPRIDIPALDLFLNRAYPFVHPLAGLVGGGWYCYLPFPYAKSLKIVCSKSEQPLPYERDRGQYWQITSKRYPGTEVETFPKKITAAQRVALQNLNRQWSLTSGDDPKPPQPGSRCLVRSALLGPGEAMDLIADNGPAIIDSLGVQMNPRDERALRSTVLRIWWDDEESPSVQSPIGDFFGNGWGDREYKALFFGMTSFGFYCHLPMPYRKNARIEIRNEDGERPVELQVHRSYHTVGALDADTGHFHAAWRCEQTKAVIHPKPADPKAINYEKNLTGRENYVLLQAEGPGRYIGTSLNINNLGNYWWGEGDPMHFVDDDTWPPTYHGTGTEEYFNDAWGFRAGHMAISGSIRGGWEGQNTNWYGKASVFTFHLADSLPFQKRLRATIEHGHANDQGNWYSNCAYWYQIEPHTPLDALPPVADRLQKLRRCNGPGRIGAEDLKKFLTGKAKREAKIGALEDLCSDMQGSRVLCIPELGKGACHRFVAHCEKSGDHLIGGYFTSGPDQGRWEVRVDGRLVGMLDLFATEATAGSFREIGRRRLTKGSHEIAFASAGRNPLSSGEGLRIEFLTVAPLGEALVGGFTIVGGFPAKDAEEADRIWEWFRADGDLVFRHLYESYALSDGRSLCWANKPADPKTGFMDCAALFGRPAGIALAVGKFAAMDPVMATVRIAHSGAIEIWINGKPAYCHSGAGRLLKSEFPVLVEPGMNHVNIRSAGNGRSWQFRVGVVQPSFALGPFGTVSL